MRHPANLDAAQICDSLRLRRMAAGDPQGKGARREAGRIVGVADLELAVFFALKN